MSAGETEILFSLIRTKRECLLRLRDLGKKQQVLIDEGDFGALLEVLAAKQKPLVQLQRLERALDPFRRQDPEGRVWQTPEERQRCAEVLQECESLLTAVLRQEKYCEGALLRRREEAARQLQGAHLAGRAREAYQAAPALPLSQVDLLSEQ
jgi:hypothetical protein